MSPLAGYHTRQRRDAGGGTDPNPSVDIQTASGTFVYNQSFSQTGPVIGFEPTCILFWGTPVTSTGLTLGAGHWMGISSHDGVTKRDHALGAVATDDGLTKQRRIRDGSSIAIMDVGATDWTLRGNPTFNADGFDLSWSNNTSPAFIIHYLAIGGPDLGVAAGISTFSDGSVSGLSIAPELVFGMTPHVASTSGSQSVPSFGYGWANSSLEQFTYVMEQADASATTPKQSFIESGSWLGESFDQTFDITGMQADGFTWTAGSGSDVIMWVAFNLGGLASKIGVLTKETSGAADAQQLIPDLGWNTQCLRFASACADTQVALGTARDMMHASGAVDRDLNQSGHIVYGQEGAHNADMQISTTRALSLTDADAVISAEAEVVALGNQPDLRWRVNNTTAYRFGYVALQHGSAL